LKKTIDSIWQSMDDIPSYTGKSKLMDKVRDAMFFSQSLHVNLQDDHSAKIDP